MPQSTPFSDTPRRSFTLGTDGAAYLAMKPLVRNDFCHKELPRNHAPHCVFRREGLGHVVSERAFGALASGGAQDPNSVAKSVAHPYNEKKDDEEERTLDDQILASEENFGSVTVCPGGVVHVNLAHCSLKLLPADFIRFSELIAQARIKFGPPRPTVGGKPRLQLVSPEDRDDSPEQPERPLTD